MMGQSMPLTDEDKLRKAAMHMESALQLLDDTDVSADIGAHIDLALCRLRDVLPASTTAVGQASSSQERSESRNRR